MAKGGEAAYDKIIEEIFFCHFSEGMSEFEFIRKEIIQAKEQHAPHLDLNPGDVPYAYRYRRSLPDSIISTQPTGLEWIIEGAGRARYRFKLVRNTRIRPREDLVTIGIPDATPELIRAYALDDDEPAN